MVSVKAIRHSLLAAAARLFFFLAAFLPRSLGLRIFGALGTLVFFLPHRDKARTIEHLRLIYGNMWSKRKIEQTARSVYRMLGKNLFDAIHLSRLPQERFDALVSHDDLSAVKKAYDQGRGVVAITAHVGCYEILLHFFARHGFKSFAIGRRMFDQRLEDLVRSLRSGEGIEYMGRDEGSLKVIRLLRQGKVFGVLIDQDTRVDGVYADFLGRPANTPSGPMKIAMKFAIPVIVVTTARQSDDTHHVYVYGPLELQDTGDFEKDLRANVLLANTLISKAIERNPDQWVWMHRRWKRTPPGNR